MRIPLPDRVAISLLAEMANGNWTPGMRFLSHRQIKRYWHVSTPTTCKSLQKLIEWGLLDLRDRSGHYLVDDFRSKALRRLNSTPYPPLPRHPGWQSKIWTAESPGGRVRRIAVVLVLDDIQISALLPRDPKGAPEGLERCIATTASAQGILRAARNTKTVIDFYADNGNETVRKSIISQIVASKAQGVIIVRRVLETGIASLANAFLRKRLPVVTAYDDCENTQMTPVNFNNIGIGHTAAQQFIRHGHRKIGVLLLGAGGEYFHDRLRGCRMAMEESGASPDSVVETEIDPRSPESIENALRRVLAPDGPTALLATHTLPLSLLYPRLRTHGVEIPRDLSVIVCSSTENIQNLERPVDIMRLDFRQIGEAAFKTLLDLLKGNGVHSYTLVNAAYEPHGSVDAAPDYVISGLRS